MTHPVILQVRSLIETAQPVEAERALAQIAEMEGDSALVEVLEQVPARDLIAIIREFDGSHDSVLHHLLTPEQFVRAVTLEAQYGERGHERLHGLINSVVYHGNAGPEAYLVALGNHEQGVATLADYFAGRVDEILHFASHGDFAYESEAAPNTVASAPTIFNEGLEDIDAGLHFGDSMADDQIKLTRAEVSDHDWMETAWLLNRASPVAFEELVAMLGHRRRLAAEATSMVSLAASVAANDSASTNDEGSAI